MLQYTASVVPFRSAMAWRISSEYSDASTREALKLLDRIALDSSYAHGLRAGLEPERPPGVASLSEPSGRGFTVGSLAVRPPFVSWDAWYGLWGEGARVERARSEST